MYAKSYNTPAIIYINTTKGENTTTIKSGTDINTNSTINYGLNPSNLTWTNTDSNQSTNHNQQITGLTTNTTYYAEQTLLHKHRSM